MIDAIKRHEGCDSHAEAVRCSESQDDMESLVVRQKSEEVLVVETCMAAMYWYGTVIKYLPLFCVRLAYHAVAMNKYGDILSLMRSVKAPHVPFPGVYESGSIRMELLQVTNACRN